MNQEHKEQIIKSIINDISNFYDKSKDCHKGIAGKGYNLMSLFLDYIPLEKLLDLCIPLLELYPTEEDKNSFVYVLRSGYPIHFIADDAYITKHTAFLFMKSMLNTKKGEDWFNFPELEKQTNLIIMELFTDQEIENWRAQEVE